MIIFSSMKMASSQNKQGGGREAFSYLCQLLLLRENGLFLSFPYVCSEPVLVK
jgi:hypothetical protein